MILVPVNGSFRYGTEAGRKMTKVSPEIFRLLPGKGEKMKKDAKF